MNINRRSLITGLVSFIAAPAIIRVTNLMPINSGLVPNDPWWHYPQFYAEVDLNGMDYVLRWAMPSATGKPVKCGDLVAGETYSYRFSEHET